MRQTILVTGGSGFIGTHLCRALAGMGHHVRVLDLLPPTNRVQGVEYLQGDVRDLKTVEDALRDVSVIYHFAAIVSVPICQTQPFESYRTNHMATPLLLDCILREKQRSGRTIRLLFASTAATYGTQGQYSIPLAESDIALEPPSFYAAQKLGSEHALRLFYQVHGIPAVVFRFFNVFGPGQDPTSPYSGVISVYLNAIRQGKNLRLNGGGTQTRDFISVHDIVSACVAGLKLPDSACDGAAINLGTGKTITIRELAEIMIQQSGLAIAAEIAPPRDGDVMHSLADNRRARELLGWAPRVSLADGLKELMS